MLKIVLFCLAFGTLSASIIPEQHTGIQSYSVKGKLLCGDLPASNVRVKLIDDDFGPDPDDDLDSGYTDAKGEFELAGDTTEFTTIDPHLKIYHDCNDGFIPCQRRWKFELPNHYITSGKHPQKTIDIGIWNLEAIMPDAEGRVATILEGDDVNRSKMTPKLFVELMKQFYELRWMLGSSGGMACCAENLVYYSPSSVQKERLIEDDLFVLNAEGGTLVRRPQNARIKESACTPVFNVILNGTEFLEAQCVIHTHSKYSNLLTQLVEGDRFEISDQEMIKGVLNLKTGKNYSNFERLVVPIIENAPQEFQLIPALTDVLKCFPESCGVLVRNHGFFVWGPTWQRTKIMLECYEYLFELACNMRSHGIPFIKSHSI